MSEVGDYLSNLVTRSLDLAAVVRPRTVSRFEPLPMDGGLASVSPSSPGIAGAPSDGEQVPGGAPPDASSPVQLLTGRPALAPPLASAVRLVPSARLQPLDGVAPVPGQHPGGWAGRPVPAAVPGSDRPSVEPAPRRERGTGQQQRLPPEDSSRPAGVRPVPPVRDPAPGRARPARPLSCSTSEPAVEPTAAPPRSTSAPLPGSPGRLDAPRAATRDGQRPVLEPAVRGVTVERAVSPDVPRLAVTAHARRAVEPARPAFGDGRESRAALEPAVRPVVARRAVSPGGPPPGSPASAETEGASPRGTPDWGSRSAREAVRPRVTVAPPPGPAVPAPAGPGATPEPAPTVQVSIGRVVVRATPPPTPAPERRRPGPPVMSLDEYLRTRTNGGNR